MEVKTGPNISAHNLHTFLWNTRDITDPTKWLKLSQFFPLWMYVTCFKRRPLFVGDTRSRLNVTTTFDSRHC